MSKDITVMEMHILNKLYRQQNVGNDYIPFHDILQGLKPHERSMKDAVKAANNLYKNGLIEFHKNRNCIALNRKNVDKVEEILSKWNGLS
jgi:hypothetical protein